MGESLGRGGRWKTQQDHHDGQENAYALGMAGGNIFYNCFEVLYIKRKVNIYFGLPQKFYLSTNSFVVLA